MAEGCEHRTRRWVPRSRNGWMRPLDMSLDYPERYFEITCTTCGGEVGAQS